VDGRVEPGGPHAEAQLDIVAVVPASVVHVRLVARIGTQQVPLGQRRPFVGPLRFLADQQDPAVETGGP
jgi:hypothetical protein